MGQRQITFSVSKIVDIIQLRYSSLLTVTSELSHLVEHMLHRRSARLSLDEFYKDFMETHGTIISNITSIIKYKLQD